MEECDIEVFTDAVAEYDSVSKLDKWKTTLLLRIKNAMKHSHTRISLHGTTAAFPDVLFLSAART